VTYPFLKGHGTENDFVLLPDHDGSVHGDLSAERVRALCDRRAGIGADGVLRVVRSSGSPLVADAPAPGAGPGGHPTPEWFMDYRNADGSVAEMCGNGIRVFAQHLYDEGLVPADEPVRIATRDGVKTVTRHGDLLRADLGPATILGDTLVSVDDRSWPAIHVTMGNPHAVVMVDDLAEAGRLCDEPTYDVVRYPDGVNVEFVARLGADHLAMRSTSAGRARPGRAAPAHVPPRSPRHPRAPPLAGRRTRRHPRGHAR
jgi:diaminopimelate epimerase